MIGGCLVKHWSKTQPTIALSSGEAELSGIGMGMAQCLGMQSLAKDMGLDLEGHVHSDATAAIGISRRRGLGKARHLHTTDLWVQENVRCGQVELHKVPGADNPADMMTKYVDRAILEKMTKRIGMVAMEGRARSAPAAATSKQA